MGYHVHYFYLGTGMEALPDRRDFGVVEAASEAEAFDIVVEREANSDWDERTRQFMRGGLTTKPPPLTDAERARQDRTIDYKALLVKYMAHVFEVKRVDLLDTWRESDVVFTEEEWAVLKALSPDQE